MIDVFAEWGALVEKFSRMSTVIARGGALTFEGATINAEVIFLVLSSGYHAFTNSPVVRHILD